MKLMNGSQAMVLGLLCSLAFGALSVLAEAPSAQFWPEKGCESSNSLSAEAVLDFEAECAWWSIPLELPSLMERDAVSEEDLWCHQELHTHAWHLERVTLAELNSGVQIVSAPTHRGKAAGAWRDLARFPTIAAALDGLDWSGYNVLTLWVHAQRPTGDVITLGVRSENPDTPHRDFSIATFNVDFQGWQEIVLPFSVFEPLGHPVGWQQVDGIYFFAQALGHHPNPYTVLHLDAISPRKEATAAKAAGSPVNDVPRYQRRLYDKPMPMLNHDFPEKVEPAAGAVAGADFITYQHYLRKERALFKYYPKFNPGYVSFDPQGRAYVFAGEQIQYLDDSGQWQSVDLKPILEKWRDEQGHYGIKNGWGPQGGDPSIRFDADGDAYVLLEYEPYNEAGEVIFWTLRDTLLLHSRDGLVSFDVYGLPGRRACFERIDGNNGDCLKHPPVILLGDYKHLGNADHDGYLLLPEKRPDGTLDLSHRVTYARDCLGVSYHSGDGNIAVTAGDKVFVAFGWCPWAPAHPKLRDQLAAEGKKWTLSNVRETPLAVTLPAIREDHPGMQLSYRHRIHHERTSSYPMGYSQDGVPTFVVCYDRQTRVLSEPVYVGSGGHGLDAHNWPAITIDPQGYLHVIINGHHNPLVYTRSLRPFDHSAWTEPQYVIPGQTTPFLSYATLTCDRQGTLYTVHRSTTDVYNNRLALYRKRPGQAWEPERSLVAPDKRLYRVWYQRMSYNPVADKLYLSYFATGGQTFMTRDYYEFAVFHRPDIEAKIPLPREGEAAEKMALHREPFWDSWDTGGIFRPNAGEMCMLVSDDNGNTWRLAVTEDFVLEQ